MWVILSASPCWSTHSVAPSLQSQGGFPVSSVCLVLCRLGEQQVHVVSCTCPLQCLHTHCCAKACLWMSLPVLSARQGVSHSWCIQPYRAVQNSNDHNVPTIFSSWCSPDSIASDLCCGLTPLSSNIPVHSRDCSECQKWVGSKKGLMGAAPVPGWGGAKGQAEGLSHALSLCPWLCCRLICPSLWLAAQRRWKLGTSWCELGSTHGEWCKVRGCKPTPNLPMCAQANPDTSPALPSTNASAWRCPVISGEGMSPTAFCGLASLSFELLFLPRSAGIPASEGLCCALSRATGSSGCGCLESIIRALAFPHHICSLVTCPFTSISGEWKSLWFCEAAGNVDSGQHGGSAGADPHPPLRAVSEVQIGGDGFQGHRSRQPALQVSGLHILHQFRVRVWYWQHQQMGGVWVKSTVPGWKVPALCLNFAADLDVTFPACFSKQHRQAYVSPSLTHQCPESLDFVCFLPQPPRNIWDQKERVFGWTPEERGRNETNVCKQSQGDRGWAEGEGERGGCAKNLQGTQTTASRESGSGQCMNPGKYIPANLTSQSTNTSLVQVPQKLVFPVLCHVEIWLLSGEWKPVAGSLGEHPCQREPILWLTGQQSKGGSWAGVPSQILVSVKLQKAAVAG